MSDAAERLLSIRAALLQWLYTELLAGRRESTPTPTAVAAGWSAAPPSRDEVAAAAEWLIDKRYASGTRTWPRSASRLRITPEGQRVAKLPGGLQEVEQLDTPTSSGSAITIQNSSGINLAIHSSNARQSTSTSPSEQSPVTAAIEDHRFRRGLVATWAGSAAGIFSAVVAVVGVVVAVLTWAPWKDSSATKRETFSMIVVGGDAYIWQQADTPGGDPTLSLPPAAGGSIVDVDCYGLAPDGKKWFRVHELGSGFLPPQALRSAYGVDETRIPECKVKDA